MHKLQLMLIERIAQGLARAGISKPSEWAIKYRVMGKPFAGAYDFSHHPWARELHDSPNPIQVGQKSAQMGFTEVAINRAFYYIDIKGESVLYVLPTERPDAVDFSASRFDPALELSPHLNNLFSDTKNLGLKRAGSACLYVRSARSRSQMKSIPAGNLIFDEVDEMTEEAITLGRERSSGQENKTEYYLSTPTVPGFGINAHYENSNKQEYFFPCPACGRRINLQHDNLVITGDSVRTKDYENSYYKCLMCKARLPHERKREWYEKAEWVAAHPDNPVAGFYVNQLYSMTISPSELAYSYLMGIERPVKMQEYYNSKLGLPKLMEGAQLDIETVKLNIKNYTQMQSAHGRFVTMGIDVGTYLHVNIDDWSMQGAGAAKDVHLRARPSLIRQLTVMNFEDLDVLMEQYGVRYAVIDKDPDRRKALEFARRYPNRVRLCNYSDHVLSGEIIESKEFVSVHRTSWLDLALGRFRLNMISLPQDVNDEYLDHLCAPMRILKDDKNGNQVARYVNVKADHYAHARLYSEVAFGMAIGLGTVKDIT